jgi:ABC-type transport system involved in multi-copper enzyme maturation permease subunit
MLQTIIHKEIRDLLGSTKFIVTFGVCVVLILLAFYMGASNYRSGVERYEAAKAENLRQMEGVTDWLRVQHHRVFLPPRPLASLISGISNDIGRTVEVEARGELEAEGSRFNEEPLFAVFRFLDLEFIFQVVLSLMAILLGYDAISGEKERGTLRLTFANPVSRSTYILGKLIGLFGALASALLLALAVGALILPLMGVVLTGEDWVRLALISLAGLLYFGAFLAVSVFVSALTQRSSSSFMLLLTVWIVGVLILPRASVLLAGRAVEVPSVDEIASQKASLASQLWTDFRTSMADFKSSVDPATGDMQAVMDEFQQYTDSLTSVRDAKMNEFTARLNEDRENRRRQQAAVAYALARLSPAAAVSLATSRLAGTSPELEHWYREAAQAYQQTYANFMFEKTGVNVGGGMMIVRMEDNGEEPEPIDPHELPAFMLATEPLEASVGGAVVDFGLLALANLIFFAGGFIAFRKYDVR